MPISVIESTLRFSGNPLPISFAGNQYAELPNQVN